MFGSSGLPTPASRASLARRVIVGVGLALAMIAAAAAAARAAEEHPPAGAGLSDDAIDERLRFIEERLDGSRLHGQIWYWSWMAINGGSTVGLGIAAGLSKHEDDQVNFGVQAGLAAIGVGDLLFRPLEARFGAAPIEGMPEETHAEKLAKLRAAEAQLRANAERAEERTSPWMHAANFALNGVAGGIIALAGRPTDGLIAFASGAVGGEINILSQPWAPASDWQDYKTRFGATANHERLWLTVTPLPREGVKFALNYQW